jgi:hypothetical protein
MEVAGLSAAVEPPLLVAVTTERSVEPRSLGWTV